MSASTTTGDGSTVFVDTFGVRISTRTWDLDAPVGLVLISHGASEHSGRYERFARALNGAGFAVAALDQRGHGRTSEATGVGAFGPGGPDALICDLHELRGSAAAALPADVPVFVFGHSMGSLIAYAYLTKHSAGLAGGLLCGFPSDPDNTAGLAALLKDAIDGGMAEAPFDGLAANNAPFEPARTGFDWLSRDDAEVDAYIADPYCGDNHPLTYGYIAGLFNAVAPTIDAIGDIECPVLVIAGGQDPAAGMGAFPATLASRLTSAGITTDLTIYPESRHELLNETNRDEVTADIVAWLDKNR